MSDETIRILYVEDEEDYVKIAEYMLRKMDEKVELNPASYLSKAFDRLDQGGIDIILLDLNLPDSRGLETVHKMVEKAPNIPIVVMTVTDDKGVAREAVEAGAQDYLVKGDYDSALLHRTIRHALARSSRKG